MLTAVSRRWIFMVEGTFANETKVYAMGVLILNALTDPSVEATHCTNMLVHIPPSVHDRHPKLATLFTDMLCTDAGKKPSLENILLHDFFSGVALKEKATEDVASALAERDETRELARKKRRKMWSRASSGAPLAWSASASAGVLIMRLQGWT